MLSRKLAGGVAREYKKFWPSSKPAQSIHLLYLSLARLASGAPAQQPLITRSTNNNYNYNNNMTSLPSYLSEAQFRKALTQTLQVPAQIVELQIKQNTVCGNYCSDIYRVTVRYTVGSGPKAQQQVQEVKILVKDLFESVAGASNEYFMYSNVLPALNETLKACGIGAVSPRVYLSTRSTTETHYFEDLSASGYVLRPRLAGYGEAEAKLLLRRLGEFHAASLIYAEKHPAVVSGLRKFYYCSAESFMTFVDKMMNDNIKHALPIVEKWTGFAEIAAKMRKNMGTTFRQRFVRIFDTKDAAVTLVSHGDVWINNILMLGDEEQPKDAVFLDYQNSFLGSPAFDIHNLLMTSVVWPVFSAKRQQLIEAYYASFSGTLKLCNYPAERTPSKACIVAELKRTEYYNYYLLLFPFTQTMLSDKLAEGMNFECFGDEERLARNRNDMFSNERVLQTFKVVLPRLNALGVLD